MAYNIGPKIGIEGEAEFRKQIKDINSAYKTLEAETKAVTAAFEFNDDQQGKLKATSQQLRKQIDMQKEKLDLLEDAVAKASKMYGENSVEANRLQGVLYDTQATISKLEKELKDTDAELGDMENATEDLADEMESAGESAASFGDILKGNLAADLIVDALDEAAEAVKDFAAESIEAAAEMTAADSQFEQAFGSLADAAKATLDSISDDTNIANTRMQASYTKIFAFAKTAGAESETALDLSSRAMIVAADSAAYYDKSIEEAAEQLQSFLKGNYENDAALGISATETQRNTKANELYAKSFIELSEAQKIDVLLAMVEAGNALSGAMGQAARESDSWSNVTGELSESIRQLQAAAGKPLMKRLIPVIQGITDGVNELVDDIDWDAFGQTVTDLIEFALDNGPAVVKNVATIGAGLTAMKATQKAGELVNLGKSFLTMGNAAKVAGESTAAGGALAAASPWGIVAAVIGGAVALLTAYALNAENAASDLERGMERFEESMDRANENYAESKSEVEGAAFAAEHYAKRLAELEAAGLNTAEAQREYAVVVEQLNGLIPDLNLVIDEQTGLVNKNTDAILAEISAWKEAAVAQALQEKYTDELEAQGRAYAELYDSQARLTRLEEEAGVLAKKRAELTQKITALEEQLSAAQADTADTTGESAVAAQELNAQLEQLREEEYQLYLQQYENGSSQKVLNKAISEAESTIAEYSDIISIATDAIGLYKQGTEEAADDHDDLAVSAEKVLEQINELAEAYDTACDEARQSIDTQIGLFDELASEGDWTAERIIKNWQSQQRAFASYADNLKKAIDLGLDHVLVKQLSDGTQESMLILDALVNDTSISIDQINAEFAQMSAGRDSVAQIIAEIVTNASGSMDALVSELSNGGAQAMAGLLTSIASRTGDIGLAISTVAKTVVSTFNSKLKINSPSRVMEDSGEDTMDGAILGVDNLIGKFRAKMEEAAQAGNDAFLQNRLDAVEAYPSNMSPVLSTTSNTNVRHNYGGINVQIYAQPGQSGRQLAREVMDEMLIIANQKEGSLSGGRF
ncbi:MAG: hypothetical protein IJO56_05920 [Oscillospiraceae bacterium]|nr:hypothetical protein [Oscillospiraceae bacterium]